MTTADQLAGFNQIRQDSLGETTFAGVTIKLGADMIFNEGEMDEILAKGEENKHFPAVHSAYLFKGIFDGQNHTVSGVYIKPGGSGIKGMFGGISGNAEIKNLRLINSLVTGSTADNKAILGTLVARVSGDTSAVTISNVEVHSTIKELGHSVNSVGGFIGAITDAANVTIKNCNYYGSITTSGRAAGGFIGAATNTYATVSVSNCANYGDITALSDAGGIIGTASLLSLNHSGISNSGKITAPASAGDLFGYKSEANDPKNGLRPQETNLRVMSFNLQSDFDSFSTAGTERLNAIKQEIYFYSPDIVAVQEDTSAVLAKFSLSGYTKIAPGTLNTSSSNCSIFYKTSLTKKTGGSKYITADGTSNTVALTAADVVSGNYKLTAAELSEFGITSSTTNKQMRNLTTSASGTEKILGPKSITWGVFTVSGKNIICVNVHLHHRSQNADYSTPAVQKLRLMERLKELYFVDEQIKTLKKTYTDAEVIITGDFNDLVGSDTYLAVKNTYGYSSAHETATLKYGVSGTWNGAFKTSNQGNSYPSVADRYSNNMLDFCFFSSGLKALKFRVGTGSAPIAFQKLRYTSDHLPIITDLYIGDTAPTVTAPSVFSGKEDTSWYVEGTKTYTLTTADQLVGMHLLRKTSEGKITFEGVTIKLGADMIINEGTLTEIINRGSENYKWAEINSAYPFMGTFDGQGHSISGIYQYATSSYRGLFCAVAGTATIKNFVLENSYFIGASNASKASFGAIIGKIDDTSANVKLTNVTLASSVLIQEGKYTMNNVGGFVGLLKNGKLTLNNCHFNGTVNFANGTHVAGFVGLTSATATLVLNNCHGSGTVSGADYVAGLAGISSGTTKTNNSSCLTGNLICAGSNKNASFK